MSNSGQVKSITRNRRTGLRGVLECDAGFGRTALPLPIPSESWLDVKTETLCVHRFRWNSSIHEIEMTLGHDCWRALTVSGHAS